MTEYYKVDEKGIHREMLLTVNNMVLKCVDEKGKQIELEMDKEQFEDWRDKLIQKGRDEK